jgi:hypothetical protein
LDVSSGFRHAGSVFSTLPISDLIAVAPCGDGVKSCKEQCKCPPKILATRCEYIHSHLRREAPRFFQPTSGACSLRSRHIATARRCPDPTTCALTATSAATASVRRRGLIFAETEPQGMVAKNIDVTAPNVVSGRVQRAPTCREHYINAPHLGCDSGGTLRRRCEELRRTV